MRKLLILITFVVVLGCKITPCTGATPQIENRVSRDTTLDVIGWFCKRDTAVYWIQESSWKLNNGDTIKTSGVSTKVMLTVTDSTRTGYKMDYTFLDVRADSLTNSELGDFQNKIATSLANKIVGTTIKFETDEYGQIVKFYNLGKIKKNAKAIIKETVKEMNKFPWVRELKEMGLDLTQYIKNIDSDLWVEGYIEELKLLFMCHGNVYELGETTEREEASETQYANETYSSVTKNEDFSYTIVSEVVNTIPQGEVKKIVAGIVDNLNDEEVKENFDANFDSSVNQDCTVSSYFKISFLPNGWPDDLVKQESTMIGNNGKVKQKYIYLDTYSFYNY